MASRFWLLLYSLILSTLLLPVACQGQGRSLAPSTDSQLRTTLTALPTRAHSAPLTKTPATSVSAQAQATATAIVEWRPAPRTKSSGCQVNGPLPDQACTPGAIFPDVTKEQVCTPGYSKSVRNVPQSVKDDVYAEYGVKTHKPGQYEVDHLIPLELGGSNDIANLFPEAAEPRPGFHEKDRVEDYLHDQVCEGKMSLREAQRQIATDWTKVYHQMTSGQ